MGLARVVVPVGSSTLGKRCGAVASSMPGNEISDAGCGYNKGDETGLKLKEASFSFLSKPTNHSVRPNPFRSISMRFSTFAVAVVIFTAYTCVAAVSGESIPVRYGQGSSHGFVALKTLDGVPIATGESTQIVSHGKVTSRLIFRFKDGSVDDDVTVFTQQGVFRLVSDHHIQHGPSFPKPIDFLIDIASGDLTFKAEDGTVSKEHMDLPPDVSNGLPPNLLLNILPSTPETKITYIAPGKKARLVHISIKPTGTLSFRVGTFRRKATDFTLHVELGGLTGIVAPIVGRQPSDYHIWLQNGVPPAFLREEGPLYEGGPIWRMEQVSPSFP